MTRILIFTPRLRYLPPAMDAAHAMIQASPVPVEWLCVDEQPHGREGPGQVGNRNVLYLYQLATARLLAGPYTHLLCLEDDIVPPQHAVRDLLACEAPVAYSLYTWRRGPPHLWSAYRRLDEEAGASWSDDEPHTAMAMAQADQVIEVAGVGLGCTLIERSVIERIPWRIPRSGRAANDWYFAYDCQRAGIRQVAHLGVRCGHIRETPSRVIIWPDPHGEYAGKNLHRYERLDDAWQPVAELEAIV